MILIDCIYILCCAVEHIVITKFCDYVRVEIIELQLEGESVTVVLLAHSWIKNPPGNCDYMLIIFLSDTFWRKLLSPALQPLALLLRL